MKGLMSVRSFQTAASSLNDKEGQDGRNNSSLDERRAMPLVLDVFAEFVNLAYK